jgi:hypothetical protein
LALRPFGGGCELAQQRRAGVPRAVIGARKSGAESAQDRAIARCVAVRPDVASASRRHQAIGAERGIHMLKQLISLAVAGVAAVAPAAAAADITVTVGEPGIMAGVSVNVPVTVTCAVGDSTFMQSGDSVFVSIAQAVDKATIAHGTGYASGGSSMFGPVPLLFPCDGTPATVAVTVPAATDGPPFKRNKDAVITAQSSAYAFGPTGYVTQSGSSGPVTARLR